MHRKDDDQRMNRNVCLMPISQALKNASARIYNNEVCIDYGCVHDCPVGAPHLVMLH